MPFWAAVMRVLFRICGTLITAAVERMPMIATTSSSSMSVKPGARRSRRFSAFGLFMRMFLSEGSMDRGRQFEDGHEDGDRDEADGTGDGDDHERFEGVREGGDVAVHRLLVALADVLER